MSRSIVKRAAAAVGVLALAALAAFGTAAPAAAVTEPGNIDPTIARSLTVHKYELSPTSPQNGGTGREIPGGIAGGVPIEGVTFTATLVPGVHLDTPEGWTTAGTLTAAQAAPLATGDTFTATTDAAGVATFGTALPIGLYLVTETDAPESVTNPTAPFLVTLPFPTGPAGSPANQWIYDVHVYPKNSVTELVKARVTPAAGSVEARNPDLIRWAVTASIPTLAPTDAVSQFVMSYTIDPASMEFVAAPPAGVAPTGVTVTNAAGIVQPFAAGTDYTVTTAGDTQTLTITPAGRPRLAGLGGGAVSFSVLSRATHVPAGGQIIGSATSHINGATETVTAVTPIGELTVLAYSTSGGVRTPLAGAQFQAYLSQADARAGTNPISIAGIDTWTTGPDGTFTYPALVPGIYWGGEIVPPTGYQMPVPRYSSTQVVAGQTSVGAPTQNYVEVPHNQVPAWALPLTGGDGALWFGVGGGALVIAAIGAAVLVARRRAAAPRATA